MPKLLIVDDDEFIRNGLRRIIDWEELGIEIVGEAKDGQEALRMFRQTGPHIVLTDIRMPNGDGLELMARIRETSWSTHIVVLSGYDDFAYLRQAMKFQVEDYLLKPVDPEELEQIARNCCKQIENRWMTEQMQKESFQLLRNNVLNRWVDNRIEAEQLREKLDFLRIEYRHNSLCLAAVIDWKDVREAELAEAERQFRPFSLLNVFDEMLSTARKGLAFLNEEKRVVLLFFGAGRDRETFREETLAWLSDATRRVSALLKSPVYCAVGDAADGASAAHQSYRDAVRLLDRIEHTGPVVCVSRREIDATGAEADDSGLTDHAFIVPALAGGQTDVWKTAFEQDFAWAASRPSPLSAAKYVAAEWAASAKEALRLLGAGDAVATETERRIRELYAESEFSAVRQAVRDVLDAVDQAAAERRFRTKHALVEAAERMIAEEYHTELSLQQLADRLHVSSIYLGRLFRAETGEYFSDVVNRLRIEQAKRMLQETTLKAAHIAKSCGFVDPNYFYRKFKQTVGLSPSEYRNVRR